MIDSSSEWKELFPASCVGLLAVENAPNCDLNPGLQREARLLEAELQDRFGTLDRSGLRSLPVFAAYDSFYKKFRKTYHVQLQLESVLFKGKPIRYPSALVGVMFLTELKTGLLIAAHDLDAVALPLLADIAQGGETYQRINADLGKLKEGDLFIKDQAGILSSVIYGPDLRTRIEAGTTQAVFTTYGPPGISKNQLREGLEILEEYLRSFAPDLERLALEVL